MKTIVRFVCATATCVLIAGQASGQIIVPILYGSVNNIYDEFGELLEGTAMNPGDLVHLFQTTDSLGILPPDLDGTPKTNTPILATVYIGNGTDPAGGPIGQFAGSLEINRSAVNILYARIYNASTTTGASFYADSRIYIPPTTNAGAFFIDVTQTSIEIDPNDDDEDGLSNSWEKSLGTRKDLVDTDGDGINDYHEFLAGTDGTDDTDYLRVVDLTLTESGQLEVFWNTTPGLVYLLEYTTNDLAAAVIDYVNLYGPVTASVDQTSVIFTNGSALNNPHIRARLLP